MKWLLYLYDCRLTHFMIVKDLSYLILCAISDLKVCLHTNFTVFPLVDLIDDIIFYSIWCTCFIGFRDVSKFLYWPPPTTSLWLDVILIEYRSFELILHFCIFCVGFEAIICAFTQESKSVVRRLRGELLTWSDLQHIESPFPTLYIFVCIFFILGHTLYSVESLYSC